jgi:hypothetical protein
MDGLGACTNGSSGLLSSTAAKGSASLKSTSMSKGCTGSKPCKGATLCQVRAKEGATSTRRYTFRVHMTEGTFVLLLLSWGTYESAWFV